MGIRRILAAAVAAFVLGGTALIGSAVTAGAGDTGPPQDELDAIRELIPEGAPGEWDQEEGELVFEDLVAFSGLTTDVGDIGTGSKLTGPCGGYAWSYDSDGELIDAAFDEGGPNPPFDIFEGGQAFTQGNRFKVDTNGVVVYFGFMPFLGDGPSNHRWEVVTEGISLDKGGDPNPQFKNRSAGIVDLADELPVKFNANVGITGELFSDNLEACLGSGHVEFIADPLVNPVAIGGIAALMGGVLGLLFNARPAQTWRV